MFSYIMPPKFSSPGGIMSIRITALIATGCSKKEDNISATYISPVTYQNFTCPQIVGEMQRVSARAAEAGGIQDKTATKDAVAMTVGIVIF